MAAPASSPFSRSYRQAGYRYDISILQAEFALTRTFDRSLSGRVFFEDMIRQNLDLGRPDQVALIFNRRISRRTLSQFRTRVVTREAVPPTRGSRARGATPRSTSSPRTSTA